MNRKLTLVNVLDADYRMVSLFVLAPCDVTGTAFVDDEVMEQVARAVPTQQSTCFGPEPIRKIRNEQ